MTDPVQEQIARMQADQQGLSQRLKLDGARAKVVESERLAELEVLCKQFTVWAWRHRIPLDAFDPQEHFDSIRGRPTTRRSGLFGWRKETLPQPQPVLNYWAVEIRGGIHYDGGYEYHRLLIARDGTSPNLGSVNLNALTEGIAKIVLKSGNPWP